MVSKKHRRDTPKKKNKTTSKPAKSDNHPSLTEWMNEGLAVLFFIVTLFLLLSFSSHQYRTLGELAGTKNLMGPLGSFLSSSLSGLMGWCMFVFVGWTSWLTYYFWTYDSRERDFEFNWRVKVLVGLVGVVLFSCSIGAVIGGRAGGGFIGTTLGFWLKGIVGKYGALLSLSGLLLLSLALASQQSVGRIVTGAALFLWSLSRFVFFSIPSVILHLVLFGVGTVASLCVGLFRLVAGLFVRDVEWEDDEDAEPLPRPTRRRNKVEEPLPDALPDDQDESRIVVERKVLKSKESLEKIKRARQRLKKLSAVKVKDRFVNFEHPPLSILTRGTVSSDTEDDKSLREKSLVIEKKLRDFGINGSVTRVHPGPVITLFEFSPAAGVKVGRIAALQDDLAMSLRASSIRIIAPIPKKGTVGIEVPNTHRDVVRLRDCLENKSYLEHESLLAVPIGKDTYGEPVIADVATMPHLLMAGATGTGKSVCINAFLMSLLYRATPSELGLILIDPKILELSIYEGVPHLKVPVVIEPKRAKAVLLWACNEMERRYRVMQKFGVRGLDAYNRLALGKDAPEHSEEQGASSSNGPESTPDESELLYLQESAVPEAEASEQESLHNELQGVKRSIVAEQLEPMEKIVIVIDELADLMLSVGREIEELITRLAQKARAAGIHLIVATQRPSVDVITGLIKANFPARLSFRVSSRIDSRTILDAMGAERLLGNGDMLFMRPGAVHVQRIHGAYVTDDEVKKFVNHLSKQGKPIYDDEILELCEKIEQEGDSSKRSSFEELEEFDPYYDQAVQLIVDKGKASTSMIQRAFRIGYNRAARILDKMEQEGVVGPMDGAKPREVLAQAIGED